MLAIEAAIVPKEVAVVAIPKMLLKLDFRSPFCGTMISAPGSTYVRPLAL